MKKKIHTNKFGELAPEPDFIEDKVVFYKIVNPTSEMREGEVWELAPLGVTPTGKVDRRGNPIFVCRVKALHRHEWVDTASAFYFKEGTWKVPVYSGDVLIREDILPETSGKVHVPSVQDISYLPSCYFSLYSTFQDTSREVDKISLIAVAKGEVKPWLQQEHIELAKNLYAQYVEYLAERENERKEKEKEIKKILSEGTKTVPSDLIENFLKEGIAIVKNGGTIWESIFDIAGFRFMPAPEDEDEKSYPMLTSAGEITDSQLQYKCRKLAGWALFASSDSLLKALGIVVPKPKALFRETKAVYFDYESLNKRENKHLYNEEQALAEMKNKVSMAQVELPQPVQYQFGSILNISFIPHIHNLVGIEWDVEEGIGAKDATTYFHKLAVGKIWVEWEINIAHSTSINQGVLDALKKAIYGG